MVICLAALTWEGEKCTQKMEVFDPAGRLNGLELVTKAIGACLFCSLPCFFGW